MPIPRRAAVRSVVRNRGAHGRAAAAALQVSRLEEVADLIDQCIETVSAAHMDETAAMLAIARVDLLARLYGVSEQEIDNIGLIRFDASNILPAE